MSNFTIKNLFDDLDNSATGRMPDSSVEEARFGRTALDSEHLGVSYFRYAASGRAPFGHRHGEQEEVYLVLSGSGSVRLDDELRDVRRWDLVRVAPSVARAFEAGPDGLEVLAIGSDRPEGGDGEVIHDFWEN
jgi:mannose-6-phosphate isomerase-like protein (cupin superfamily)